MNTIYKQKLEIFYHINVILLLFNSICNYLTLVFIKWTVQFSNLCMFIVGNGTFSQKSKAD